MALLLVELGLQTAQVLGVVRLLVALTGFAFARALFMVEALAVLLLPAFDVPVVLLASFNLRLLTGGL